MHIYCEICKNKVSSLFKIEKFPEFTINNKKKKFPSKKKSDLEIFFCNFLLFKKET